MTRSCIILAACLSILIPSFTFPVGAQSLPSLPKASEVVTGTLPNGIAYYLVTNPEAEGLADFALVQKNAANEEQSRSVLSELPHFQGGKPYQYLAKLGVGYENFGYLRFEGGSGVYHLKDIPVSRQEVRDTTLLLLFDMAETCPSEQAVIISGDIDAKTTRERMDVFSMMVTARQKGGTVAVQEFNPSDSLHYVCVQTSSESAARLTVSYLSPRTPKEAMNTVQPLVSSLFAKELGFIVKTRAEKLFYDRRIPVADMSWDYRSSADSPLPERYSFSVTVPSGMLKKALSAFAGILSELDTEGASLDEFREVRDMALASLSKNRLSNGEWVDKCLSSYLYGSDLASPLQTGDFFKTRNIDAEVELGLFNDFVSAIVDERKGLYISCSVPGQQLSRAEAVDAFSSGWKSSKDVYFSSYGRDTLGLHIPKKVKAKLKRVVPEPVTGGEMWTFSNGMKVIYKKVDSSQGTFSYGFLLNGGFAGVPDLVQGEGGYVSEMLSICDVSGLTGRAFHNMLEANGISFRPAVSLTDLRIVGTAPSSRLQLLLKSLLSVANDRAVNKEAYQYFKESELLRLSGTASDRSGVDYKIDSIISPEYLYTESRYADALSADLPERSEACFSKLFADCSDGVLVLMGDLDPFALKKILPKYLGGFATGGVPSSRPQIRMPLRSGWSTYTVESSENNPGSGNMSVNVVETVPLPFNLERYFASQLSVMELEKKLASSLCETGMYTEVNSSYDLYPVERLTVRISCRPASIIGLPAGVVHEDPFRVLGAVRSAMAEMASGQTEKAEAGVASQALSNASLESSKSYLQARYDSELASPSGLVNMALARYSLGKDFVTGYKDKIKAVKPEAVKEILTSLEEGSKIEYVIY